MAGLGEQEGLLWLIKNINSMVNSEIHNQASCKCNQLKSAYLFTISKSNNQLTLIIIMLCFAVYTLKNTIFYFLLSDFPNLESTKVLILF